MSRPVDVSLGDVIAAASDPVAVSDQFQARLIWMDDEPLVAGRGYLLKIHSGVVSATVTRIKHALDVEDGSQRPAATLALADVGLVNIAPKKFYATVGFPLKAKGSRSFQALITRSWAS